ncbi:hypothetical protein Tco_1223747 [Tanacetum coccineum]
MERGGWVDNRDRWRWSLVEDGEFTVKKLSRLIEEKNTTFGCWWTRNALEQVSTEESKHLCVKGVERSTSVLMFGVRLQVVTVQSAYGFFSSARFQGFSLASLMFRLHMGAFGMQVFKQACCLYFLQQNWVYASKISRLQVQWGKGSLSLLGPKKHLVSQGVPYNLELHRDFQDPMFLLEEDIV